MSVPSSAAPLPCPSIAPLLLASTSLSATTDAHFAALFVDLPSSNAPSVTSAEPSVYLAIFRGCLIPSASFTDSLMTRSAPVISISLLVAVFGVALYHFAPALLSSSSVISPSCIKFFCLLHFSSDNSQTECTAVWINSFLVVERSRRAIEKCDRDDDRGRQAMQPIAERTAAGAVHQRSSLAQCQGLLPTWRKPTAIQLAPSPSTNHNPNLVAHLKPGQPS